MAESKKPPTGSPENDSLREEYKQRNEYQRYWATEQRLVALAVLTFNGVALANVGKLPLYVILLFMIALGAFGFVHNNRLSVRYDQNEKRLITVAQQLYIRAVFHEDDYDCHDHKGYNPKTMRFWFYSLYVATIGLWTLYSVLQ
jgi:hypothetical protein